MRGAVHAARLCAACEAFVSPRCVICRGAPDPGVSLEQLARGVAQVDRAVSSNTPRQVDVIALVRAAA
jgi:hypothetical protein